MMAMSVQFVLEEELEDEREDELDELLVDSCRAVPSSVLVLVEVWVEDS